MARNRFYICTRCDSFRYMSTIKRYFFLPTIYASMLLCAQQQEVARTCEGTTKVKRFQLTLQTPSHSCHLTCHLIRPNYNEVVDMSRVGRSRRRRRCSKHSEIDPCFVSFLLLCYHELYFVSLWAELRHWAFFSRPICHGSIDRCTYLNYPSICLSGIPIILSISSYMHVCMFYLFSIPTNLNCYNNHSFFFSRCSRQCI